MNAPSFIEQKAEGIVLKIRAQPRASRNAVIGVIGEELKIAITAPPVDSAANEALVNFLAAELQVPRSAVRILRGGASRHKQALVCGLSMEEAIKRLCP